MDFDLFSDDFKLDPYAYYGKLRRDAPVLHWKPWNMWFLSRFRDCAAALKDPRLGREAVNAYSAEQLAAFRQPPDNQRPLYDMERKWLVFLDPPTHTRLRTLVHKAFTPHTVERLRTDIQQIVNDLLSAVQERNRGSRGHIDIMHDLASPLPVAVIAKLIGIPVQDEHAFRHWSQDLAFTLELTDDPAIYDKGAVAAVEFSAYLRDLIAQRRADPRDDLLTALISAEEAGDKLNESELIATVIFLLVAGHETTTKLIGNGVLALLRHPEQLARLKADFSLTRNAVEEILRYDSPVQFTSRIVLADDVEIGGCPIPRGREIGILLGAANRDLEQFSDPDTFDISRPDADKHIGFGNGIHFCLGAPLARLEGEIALKSLFQRFPDLALGDEPPRYRPTFVLRGLDVLPAVY